MLSVTLVALLNSLWVLYCNPWRPLQKKVINVSIFAIRWSVLGEIREEGSLLWKENGGNTHYFSLSLASCRFFWGQEHSLASAQEAETQRKPHHSRERNQQPGPRIGEDGYNLRKRSPNSMYEMTRVLRSPSPAHAFVLPAGTEQRPRELSYNTGHDPVPNKHCVARCRPHSIAKPLKSATLKEGETDLAVWTPQAGHLLKQNKGGKNQYSPNDFNRT